MFCGVPTLDDVVLDSDCLGSITRMEDAGGVAGLNRPLDDEAKQSRKEE